MATKRRGESAKEKDEKWNARMAKIHERFVRPHLMGDSLEETRDRCSLWLQNFIRNL